MPNSKTIFWRPIAENGYHRGFQDRTNRERRDDPHKQAREDQNRDRQPHPFRGLGGSAR